jgi:alkyl hydroperoxide reductase subunit F
MNHESSSYDLAIIGGGPAGVAAGVYSARKKIKTILITEGFRGQSAVAGVIQNWIGEISISGEDLHKKFENHLKSYAKDIEIKEKETVIAITKNETVFIIKTNKAEYAAKTILITTGSVRRKLIVKGAEEFEGKGITYCATCDAPMFGEQDVAVIGGGNSAFEAVTQLLAYAKTITIVQRSEFRAEPIMVQKILSNPKVRGITNVDILEIKGDKFVSGIIYKDKNTGELTDLPVAGIFVEIGANPSLDFLEHGLVNLNEKEEVIIDPKTQKTGTAGIWAAGDCTDGLYKQNNIAVGDAVKAVEDIYKYLKN